MQFTTLLLTAAITASVIAAPAPTTAKSMMAQVDEWTIENMVRICDDEDTTCNWSFTINTHTADPTPCQYNVTGTPASQTTNNGATCDAFTVTSTWSGQFGPDHGFTTLSVIDYDNKLIAYPAYDDVKLENGVVVTPDLSFAPQTLAV